MKLFAPSYYLAFQCIASRCPHSCCIGWEIDVDETTLKSYQRLVSEYGAVIKNSISMEGTPHFRLEKGDRCPHLNERGLCKIILNEGEALLCRICREHPRFYNYTSVAEVGLGMSCPEAARLILSRGDYAAIEEIGCVDALPDDVAFDGRAERQALYKLLQDPALAYSSRLERIYQAYGIEPGEDAEWLKKLEALEYLDASHKPLFMTYSASRRPRGAEEFLERFLAYLIYRHCTEAFDPEDFAVRLGFCLFCERLLASMICTEQADSPQGIERLAVILSEEIEYSEENTLALS